MKAYTSKAVAAWLDISERRVRQLRDEKVITEIRPGLYDLKTVNHQYINYLRKNNPESESAIDYNAERAKLVRAKRELMKKSLVGVWSSTKAKTAQASLQQELCVFTFI